MIVLTVFNVFCEFYCFLIMARSLRSGDEAIFLVGDITHQITGAKLPSKRQVLSVLFYNIRKVGLSVSESARLVIKEVETFWEKGRIPTSGLNHSSEKLIKLYNEWRDLQKNRTRIKELFRQREKDFEDELENLFDIAHQNAFELIRIEEDKIFLESQRKPGREGCMIGTDRKLKQIEERRQERKERAELHREKALAYDNHIMDHSDNGIEIGFEDSDGSSSSPSKRVVGVNTRGRQSFITPKLVGVLDRCQLSIRDAVYVLSATAEALGHDINKLVINQTSIHRSRLLLREEQALRLKSLFQDHPPLYVTVHWDGKILPALKTTGSKEERLPIVITSGNIEKLISVPILENGTGISQATAVYTALSDWDLLDKVQIASSDTTASNTGHINGAFVLLRQKLGRSLLYFPCRHHIYELILKSVFECKLPQVRK